MQKAEINEVNLGIRRGYDQSDILFAADSSSRSSTSADVHDNMLDNDTPADPGHVTITMVGGQQNGRNSRVNGTWQDAPDNAVYRYNAAYDPAGDVNPM